MLARASEHPLERRARREPEQIADAQRIVRDAGRWTVTKLRAAIRCESAHELPCKFLRQARA